MEIKEECTDFSLISECKLGKQKALISLFTRYEPYLHKKFDQIKVQLKKNRNFMEFEDFKQEAYFYFIKAVNYTNLLKIHEPATWKFMTPYMYFIRALIRDILRKDIRDNKSIKYTDLEQQKDSKSVLHDIEDTSRSPKDILLIQEESIEEFHKSLTKEELLLCDALELAVDLNPKAPVKAVAHSLGYSIGWGYMIYKKIQSKYLHYSSFSI